MLSSSVQSHTSSFATASHSSENLLDDTVPDVTGLPIEERLLENGALEIGSAKAKRVMTLFTNHDCEYCQDFQNNLLPHLIQNYVSKGKLRIDIVPFKMAKYPNSDASAAIVICAATQGKGAAMNQLLFANVDKKTLRKNIADLKLDFKALDGCTSGQWVEEQLQKTSTVSDAHHITLVPSYILGEKTFTGLPEWSDLRGQVDAMIK